MQRQPRYDDLAVEEPQPAQQPAVSVSDTVVAKVVNQLLPAVQLLAATNLELIRAEVRAEFDRRERREEWLTTNEAAAYLKVNVRTIRRRVEDGRLPAKRVSGVLRIPLSALKSMDNL